MDFKFFTKNGFLKIMHFLSKKNRTFFLRKNGRLLGKISFAFTCLEAG